MPTATCRGGVSVSASPSPRSAPAPMAGHRITLQRGDGDRTVLPTLPGRIDGSPARGHPARYGRSSARSLPPPGIRARSSRLFPARRCPMPSQWAGRGCLGPTVMESLPGPACLKARESQSGHGADRLHCEAPTTRDDFWSRGGLGAPVASDPSSNASGFVLVPDPGNRLVILPIMEAVPAA